MGLTRAERRRAGGEVVLEVERDQILIVGKGDAGSSCEALLDQLYTPAAPPARRAHPQRNDHALPAAHGANVGTASISSTFSICSPAPEYLVVRAELVDASVEVGEQHQLLVGVERRDESRLPHDFGRACRGSMMISYRSLGEELELAPLQRRARRFSLDGSRAQRLVDVQQEQPWRWLQLQRLHYSPCLSATKLQQLLECPIREQDLLTLLKRRVRVELSCRG